MKTGNLSTGWRIALLLLPLITALVCLGIGSASYKTLLLGAPSIFIGCLLYTSDAADDS